MFKAKRLYFLLICLFFMVVNPHSVLSREEITLFKTDIDINTDGSITVTDNISVNVEHKTIRLGLVIDFNKYRHDEATNKKVKTNYDFLSVKRNGQKENFWTETKGNKIELYLGAVEDRYENFIPLGINTYEIKYRVTNMISFFTEEDGFYYNATGSEWEYPINNAYTEIHLPKGAEVNAYSGYTGAHGATGKDYHSGIKSDGAVWFEASRPLNRREGLTISVSFSKGFVGKTKNIDTENILETVKKVESPLFWAILVPVIVFLYYIIAWFFVGKDLPEETVVPTYIAPKDISPILGAKLLGKSISGEKEIVTVLISLIQKDFISLIKEGDNFKINLKKSRDDAGTLLANEEKVFFDALYAKADNIEKKNKGEGKIKCLGMDLCLYETGDNDPVNLSLEKDSSFIYKAYCLMRGSYARNFAKYIIYNTKFKVYGALLTLFLYIGESVFSFPYILAVLGLSIGTLMPLAIFTFLFKTIKDLPSRMSKIIFCIIISLWLLPFILTMPSGMYFIMMEDDVLDEYFYNLEFPVTMAVIAVIFSVILTVLTNIIFFFIMKKKTSEGVKATASIKGLYTFMEKVDKDRYTKITPDIFERNLAYAVAFGLENVWVERFKLTSSAADIPTYYTHISSPSFHKAIYKSTPAAHSSSHRSGSSRGGGHSGGGGGHGGGRGR